MKKEQNVLNYYIICNKLKTVIRKGWLNSNLKSDRLESVAEHIYSTQMLAISMYSEYGYDADILKVIYMLAIHEIGEAAIGDITYYEMDGKTKREIEHEAVHQILSGLFDGELIEEYFLEFDDHKTKEAFLAYQCDKADCDIQCRLYDIQGCVENSNILEWSKKWIERDMKRIPFDENFRELLNDVLSMTSIDDKKTMKLEK